MACTAIMAASGSLPLHAAAGFIQPAQPGRCAALRCLVPPPARARPGHHLFNLANPAAGMCSAFGRPASQSQSCLMPNSPVAEGLHGKGVGNTLNGGALFKRCWSCCHLHG